MVIDKNLEILNDLDNYIIFKIPEPTKESLKINLTFYSKFKSKYKSFILKNFKVKSIFIQL